MGTLTEALVKARLRYFESGGSLLDILDWACGGDGALVADALEVLDGCTPHPWTFQLYVCGAYWTPEGEVAYGPPRNPKHVLAVMGRACVRAVRMEMAA